ncbi:MAG: galactose-1-phosphate uridylyltransferase [Nitrososphaeraceae archaeon]
MAELRKDYILEKFVVLPPETYKVKNDTKQCPYCPGNESMTPPSVLSLVVKEGMLQRLSDNEENIIENWDVRVFPNSNPVVTSVNENNYRDKPLYSEPAYGYHYIVVATPQHDESLPRLSIEKWSNVLLVLQNYLSHLYTKKSVTYVSIFVNNGVLSGSDIDHAHFHLMTFSTIPPIIESEAEASNRYLNENGNCPACNIISTETGGPRQILDTENYIAISPWASTYPYEFWIYPKRHTTSFSKISQKEFTDLALILRSTLGGMDKVLEKPSFNLIFHLSPEKKNSRQIHWHIEVYPQLHNWSGLERGFGVYVNHVSPERSAQVLGSAARKEFGDVIGIK